MEEHLNALFDSATQLNLNYIVLNSQPVSEELKSIYRAEGAEQIGLELVNELEIACRGRNISIVAGDLLDETGKVRHAPHKLAELLLNIYHSWMALKVVKAEYQIAELSPFPRKS